MEWEIVKTIPSDFGIITCIAISPNSDILAAATDYGMIMLVDLNKFEKIMTKTIHSKGINQVVWSNNGHYLISCSDDETVQLLNSQNLETLRSYKGIDSPITCCDISPSCELIVGGDEEGHILLWATSISEPRKLDEGHLDAITSIHISSSLSILASSIDGIVRLFSPENLELLRSYSESTPVSNALFSPDDRYITFSLLDNITYIADASGQFVGEFTGYVNQEYTISPCFYYDRNIPDGPVQFIIPSEDGRLISYDFETQKQLWEFKPHDGLFKWAISKNGIIIATAVIEKHELVIWKRVIGNDVSNA